MQTTQTQNFDIVIIGGGLVGASLACALGDQDVRVAVVEAVPLQSDDQPSYDERTLALSFGSAQIFAGLGVWSRIKELGATPIRSIHVSDRGYLGKTRLHAHESGVDALGYVVPTRVIGCALSERLSSFSNITLFCPAMLQSMQVGADSVTLTIQEASITHTLSCRLIIGADGVDSAVRKLANIGARTLDYQQDAIIGSVSCEKPHQNIAYERFTSTGPIAMLPLPAFEDDPNRCAMVWTVRREDSETTMALDDATFLAQLQARFGTHLGKLMKIGKRSVYPLSLRHATRHVLPRLALIGNAAHTLHPIAGQGFNLGLRDVAVLAQVIVDAVRQSRDPGALTTLETYASWQRRDQSRVISFTDGLVRAFSNRFPPLAMARNLGMFAAEIIPGMKQRLARQAMGLAGRQPRLTRGLPL